MKKLFLSTSSIFLRINGTKSPIYTLLKISIFFWIIFFSLPRVNAQCPEGYINLTTQQQVDDFASTYPGCTELSGGLAVRNDVSNLNGLSNITDIAGELNIQKTNLTNLTGLENLTTIGGALRIGSYYYDYLFEDFFLVSNYDLISLEGLNNLTSVGGHMDIVSSTVLTDITALSNLTSIGGHIEIAYNPLLSACNASAVCNHINNGGAAIINDNALGCNDVSQVISSCPLVCGTVILTTQQEVDGFASTYPGCTEFSGNLRIEGNTINNLNGLSNITGIAGDLQVFETNLTNFIGLENLTNIGGTFRIGNFAIEDPGPPECFSFVRFEGSPNLTNFEGLENLQTIGGSFNVQGNSSLNDFTGLQKLDSIGGIFYLLANPLCTNFTGLENLRTIGGFNTRGCTFFEFPGGDDYCSSSPTCIECSISSFTGLDNLSAVKGDFVIVNCDSLNDFTGLENLTDIEGQLSIGNSQFSAINIFVGGNNNLSSLTGLENLVNVGNGIDILANSNLSNIEALENINQQNLNSLKIIRNGYLAACSISSICNYLEDGGTAAIENNASGCNTQVEVEEACALPIEMAVPLQIYLNNQTAILKWRTDTETNNTGFEIQRSKDGISWERIGWQAGQGTTTSPHSYTYKDTKPLLGTSYYRLKQVDFDGNFEYSNAVSLRYIPAVVEISPNPGKGIFQVNGIPQGTYQIQDATGRIIQSGDMKDELSIDISQEAKGVYFISIHVESEVITRRIIKL